MPSQANIQTATYVEQLAQAINEARPFFVQCPLDRPWSECEKATFPDKPGVYVILRKVSVTAEGYRYAGLNSQNPIVLYVGRTTARRNIRERLGDHFGCKEPNFQGSQFIKFLMQVVQDEQVVKQILWSPNTLIACVAIPDSDVVIQAVERLAMQVFAPRFNIKDR